MALHHRFAVCLLVGFGLLGSSGTAQAELTPTGLRCEYLVNPLGIDVAKPRLSWVLQVAHGRGARQTAYQVLVARAADTLVADRGDLWDSGQVASDQSIQVVYAGRPLDSYQDCYWKVRAWDAEGHPGPWSPVAHWSMGILEPAQWRAKWIAYTKPFDKPQREWTQAAPSPVFRKEFALEQTVKSATISVCGLGYYELHLNGAKVGDHVLDPAFTRYDKRALYATYDVTGQMRGGANALGVMLGNGWYNSHTRCVWDFDKAPWRDRPKLLLQLRVVFADDSEKLIVSDESWRASTGPMQLDGIRNGHVYDARLEMPGWDAPGFDDKQWAAAEIATAPGGVLRAQMLPPIKVTQTIPAASVRQTRPGVWLFDLGQSIAGWAQLRVAGPAGTEVKMVYSERAAADGTIDRKTIAQHVKSGPFQTDIYILKGQGVEQWEPKFAYHGFRWVEVTGLPGNVSASMLSGRVVQTAFERTGEFTCSNELFNTIQQHTLWSYRGNFHGYPTDCPHREKNGWTGDAHLAAEQAMFNFENTAGYVKWLDDLADEQQPDGNLPGIVPTSGWGYKWGNGPAWDSAYPLIAWYLYQYRDDRRGLEQHYDRLKRYVDYMTAKAKDNLVQHGLGDWVPAKTQTPVIVTSSGYYYVDTKIVADIATMLGKTDDAKKYGDLAQAIAKAFHAQLYKGDGVYSNGSQTALSCALYQGLVPDAERSKVALRLAEAVEARDRHLDTGILGAKYLLRSLSETGRHDLAYAIACQKTPPSYGDWIARGATTLWEDWKDGESRNHIMFGDISAWFYSYLAGIRLDPAAPAFKRLVFRPEPVADLTRVDASIETPYGKAASHWRWDNGQLVWLVTVPTNTTATVWLPTTGGAGDAREGDAPLAKAQGVKLLRSEPGALVLEVAAGQYRFSAPYAPAKK